MTVVKRSRFPSSTEGDGSRQVRQNGAEQDANRIAADDEIATVEVALLLAQIEKR